MSNFWDSISFGSVKTSSMDEVLATKISDLTNYGRKIYADTSSYTDGVRVYATTNNGLLIPNRLPSAGTKGTVVSVRTASGEVTSLEGEVFVQWDGRGDKIDRVPVDFIRVATMRVANLDNFIVLSGPSLTIPNSNATGELVHKSTKDLWSVKVGEDGSYEIERLFNDSGEPLKV